MLQSISCHHVIRVWKQFHQQIEFGDEPELSSTKQNAYTSELESQKRVWPVDCEITGLALMNYVVVGGG